jgi:hypothetical protein
MQGTLVDHTEAYRRFRDAAASQGFAKAPPEDVGIWDKKTITVATDGGKELLFFDASDNDLYDKQQDPLVRHGQALPADAVLCIHSVGVFFDQQNYAGTLTELADALFRLGDSVLEVSANSDRFISHKLKLLLGGSPGTRNTTDTATSTTQVKGDIRCSALIPLKVPKVLQPGSQIKAKLAVTGAFTTNNDIVAELYLGAWMARKGAPPGNALGMLRL